MADGPLSSTLADLATLVANNSGGLQAGLVEISVNPLAGVIANVRANLVYYTTNNYQNLDLALPVIAADGSLTVAYSSLKNSLGGSDGLSGAVAYLDRYQDHTDRLSGLVLSSDSQFATTQLDSKTEYLTYFGVPSGVNTAIISFSSKKYRSAKYLIQCSCNSEHQTSEVYVTHDNSHVYSREVDLIYTRDPFINFTSQIVNNTISILANTILDNTNIVVYGTRLEISTPANSLPEMSQKKILESAAVMRAYYPDSTTDYVLLQSGSLYTGNLVAELSQEVSDIVPLLLHQNFLSLSSGDKSTYISNLANAINTKSQSIQASIDSDITQYMNIAKQLEAVGIVSSIVFNYSNSKSVLDLTLTSKIKDEIQ
jgi:hypothetical protein